MWLEMRLERWLLLRVDFRGYRRNFGFPATCNEKSLEVFTRSVASMTCKRVL